MARASSRWSPAWAPSGRGFYEVMQKIRRCRLRTRAFEWPLARENADRELWTERYHYPTCGDYLRQRSRATQTDADAESEAHAFLIGELGARVRRRLE